MVSSASGRGSGDDRPPATDMRRRGAEPDGAVVPSATTVEAMDLVGGEPCLELVNTGSSRSKAPFKEKLHQYGDLVTLAERTGLVDADGGERLRRRAEREPERAAEVLERARRLREAVYRSFTAVNEGRAPSEGDLEVLAEEAAAAAAARRLVPGSDCCEYAWREEDRLERPLWPLAVSAAELATSEEIGRVKECAADNCNWLFYDASRNRSRRWCDMRECGNRAKVRRYRKRASGGS
jgi:predicted RNA-binding Zn ribbon-like protein